MGGAVGTMVGVRHGERVDREQCRPECGGPPLNGLVDGIIFGTVGAGLGGLVAYLWP
jgi:hypothetical protein